MQIELKSANDARREHRPRHATRRDTDEPVRFAVEMEGGRRKLKIVSGNPCPFDVARAIRRYRKRKAEATPEQRKQRMAAKWTARMRALAERGHTPARDLSRERMARQRGTVLADSCNGRIF